MRRFSDTLPTLRDSKTATDGPPLSEVARFDPPFLVRTKAVPGVDTAGAAEGAGIKALLKRRGIDDAVPSAVPTLSAGRAQKPARMPSAIPSLDVQRDTTDELIAAAVADARREADSARAAAVELARKVERDVAARAIAEARAAWCTEEAAAVAARFDAAFEALHVRLSNAMAEALAPIALAAIKDQALRRFAAMLDDLAGRSADAPAILVEGPADLVAALEAVMGTHAGVTFRPADRTEIVADIGDTRLETTLGAWAENLAIALGQGHG